GINWHGWAHEYGAISSTVISLEVIGADGELKTLTPKDELFGCFFGTLGYFGVVVSATLKLVDNDHLIERMEEIELDEFVTNYESKIKGQGFSLFGGRLVLDDLEGNPLRKVCMVRYEKDLEAQKKQGKHPLETKTFVRESSRGTRMERISLQAIGHLSHYSTRRAISTFWKKERVAMMKNTHLTRNEALHPPIKAF